MRRALLLLCGLAAAQTTTTVFEAADVHVSPPGAAESEAILPGGRLEFRAITMLRLINRAYSVPVDSVAGGPAWLDTDRFDVIARAPSGASEAAMQAMLQTLLIERFALEVRREEKPAPVYVLLPPKRNPPKESAGGDPGCKRGTEDGHASVTCHNMTIAALAESLPGLAPGYFNHPVVDKSGLTGTYDFTLGWVGRANLGPGSEGNSLSLYNVIEKQLGVKVEQQTAPMPVLTVTRVNQNPIQNPPGTTEKLGAPPTEFDVAEVRPSSPDEKENFEMNNGRIKATMILLKDLIQFAYNVEDDGVRNGPKWLESERFDITAKTAPTASEDTLRTMVRSLLEQRFGLTVHMEKQPVGVFGLTAAKPKLKDAEASERSTCRITAADGARMFTCANVTMGQFVERLRPVANGYVDRPIVDLTGLKGSYDFVLTWSPVRRIAGRAPSAPAGEGAIVPSADPTGAITLFEAIDRQLGLKLSERKHPMPVVVIDKVERKPSE